MEYLKELIKKFLSIIFYLFRIFKIKNNKIIFISYYGKGYGGNCKYIVESLLDDEKIDIVWSVNKKNDVIPSRIRQVKYKSIKWYYEMVTAKIWINNCRMPSFVRKRKKQKYIQVWHGSLMLKKIEFDVDMPIKYLNVMKNDNRIMDEVLSSSNFFNERIRNSFKYYGKILEYGTPKEEVLLKNKNLFKEKVKKQFEIKENEKLLLYAPTFRDKYEDKNPYDIKLLELKKQLEKKYNCKWKIIYKLHPNLIDKEGLIQEFNNDDIINATKYPDVQELMAACDLLITDYSSIMLECLQINIPVILYANDIKSYINERGFYFKFDELPFPLTQNNKELLECISQKYNFDNYKTFLEKLGVFDSSRATELMKKEIKSILNSG